MISPQMTTLNVSHKVDGDTSSNVFVAKNISIAVDIYIYKNFLSANRVGFNLQVGRWLLQRVNRKSKSSGA